MAHELTFANDTIETLYSLTTGTEMLSRMNRLARSRSGYSLAVEIRASDSVGELMKRFVAGADRSQSTLLPESLDDWVDESNPVRVIDAFVDALNLAELGFDRVKPAVTGGRPIILRAC